MSDFNQELEHAASEAVFGMQMDRNAAVKFVLNNVGSNHRMTNEQAEQAVNDVMTHYKSTLGG